MMNKLFKYICLIMATAMPAFLTPHKIVIQLSPPRCLSTASLRMWQARGDFRVFNEPFVCAFLHHYAPETHLESFAAWWREGAPKEYEDVIQNIFELAKDGPVFIKDISFSLAEYLKNNPRLLSHPDVYFIFLIRNPHHAISSYYQKLQKIIDDFCYLSGFKPTYELYQLVKQRGANKPIILHAEDLYIYPEQTAQALCNALAIPFTQKMLQWNNLGTSFTGVENWSEIKTLEVTQHWHDAAINSSGFHKPATYATDENGNPTFAEVNDEADRAECIKAYKINKKYYDLLLNNERISP